MTNLNNGRTIVVRINDRGPYASDRIIDLSRRSAELLGFRDNGTATVRVKYLGRAPLNGDDSYERKYLASQSWMQVAAKGKSSKAVAVAVSSSLPAENPENLQAPWKQAAPREAAPPDQAGSADARRAGLDGNHQGGRRTRAGGCPYRPRLPALPAPQSTGSIPPVPKPQGASGRGSSSRPAPSRARTTPTKLARRSPRSRRSKCAEIEVGGNVYFRVRVGPFAANIGSAERPWPR